MRNGIHNVAVGSPCWSLTRRGSNFCEFIDLTVLKLSLLAHENLKLQRKRVLCQTSMVGEIHSEAKKNNLAEEQFLYPIVFSISTKKRIKFDFFVFFATIFLPLSRCCLKERGVRARGLRFPLL